MLNNGNNNRSHLRLCHKRLHNGHGRGRLRHRQPWQRRQHARGRRGL